MNIDRAINHTAHLHKHLSLYSGRIFRILLAVKLLSRITKQNDLLRRPPRTSPDASRMHGLLSRHAPKRKLLLTPSPSSHTITNISFIQEIRARRLPQLRTRPPTPRQQRRDPRMHIPGL
jgi:hypothetical protein